MGKLFEAYRTIDKVAHAQRMAQNGMTGATQGNYPRQTNEQIQQDMLEARRNKYFAENGELWLTTIALECVSDMQKEK